MTTWTKICGLTTRQSVEAAVDAGADAIGLVFFPPSPRHVDPSDAARLVAVARDRAGPAVEIVALTVNADDALLAEIDRQVAPDTYQFHGSEQPERVAEINARFGRHAMKAIAVSEPSDLADVARYVPVVDQVMFDAKPPKDATRPGGNGEPFDWTMLAALDLPVPFVLSGGLNPSNVVQAIKTTAPWGVDVSSGVEDAPGVKNNAKIADFVGLARNASIAKAGSPKSEALQQTSS